MCKTKRFLLFLVAVFTLLISSNVYAMGPFNRSSIAIGNIVPGQDIQYVIQIYGRPTSVSTEYVDWMHDYITTYEFGHKFFVSFHPKDGINNSQNYDYITSVATEGNNGISTGRGIHVGSTRRDLLTTYGKPDEILHGNKYNYYFGAHGISFTVVNNKVVRISNFNDD